MASSSLWFDVESKYEATCRRSCRRCRWLWFDVESKYEATQFITKNLIVQLWFDVESKYEATESFILQVPSCCGLM